MPEPYILVSQRCTLKRFSKPPNFKKLTEVVKICTRTGNNVGPVKMMIKIRLSYFWPIPFAIGY